MTAINVFLQPSRALMMTDGTLYTPNGDVVGFGPKASVMPTLKAAVACQGSQMAAQAFASEASIMFPSFDAFLQHSSTALPQWFDASAAALADAGMADLVLIVAGWSDEKRAAVGVYYDSREGAGYGEIEDYISGPMLDDAGDADLHSIGCELEVDVPLARVDPVRHGIPYMEAQRRMAVDYHGRMLHIVGGHIMVTECSADGVSQRVIHRWPDVAGEPIRAEPFTRDVSAPIAFMSRQQRRAAEREARRVKA